VPSGPHSSCAACAYESFIYRHTQIAMTIVPRLQNSSYRYQRKVKNKNKKSLKNMQRSLKVSELQQYRIVYCCTNCDKSSPWVACSRVTSVARFNREIDIYHHSLSAAVKHLRLMQENYPKFFIAWTLTTPAR